MLAHHPLTGAPIKVMKTETHLYKNQKTLAWLRTLPEDHLYPKRFLRWDTVVTSLDTAVKWRQTLGEYPSAIVLREPSDQIKAWLFQDAPKQKQILFLSKAVMDDFGPDQFRQQKFINVICLDELGEMFPHVLHKYAPTDSDSTTVLSLAIIFRASRLFGLNQQELTDADTQYLTVLKDKYTLATGRLRDPESLWLITQAYDPGKPKRARELKKCLDQNLACPYVDQVVLLNETDMLNKLPTSPKLRQVVTGERLTYAHVIEYIKSKVPEHTLIVFLNSDIYLDSTWSQLWSLNMRDIFLSLLRYEEPTDPTVAPELFGPRPDSQDTWVILSDSVKSREWDLDALKFPFGQAGCDNAINVEMLKKRFIVANPCLSLRTLHCHHSEHRTYNPHDIVDKPFYLYLDPTGLHDLEPKRDLSTFEQTWTKAQPFSRRVYAADSKALKTFCAMVTREEEENFQVDTENLYEPPVDERLYEFKNTFTTPNGLCYGYKSIYLGKQEAVREAWAETVVSHITPCIGVNRTMTAYCPDSVASNVFVYLTKYLSRIFRMKDAGISGDFWLPRTTNRLQEFLQAFKWDETVLPVLPRDESVAAFAETATMLSPRDKDTIYKEDIEALRSRLRAYVELPQLKKAVIVQDDTTIDAEDAYALESRLESLGYETEIVYVARSSPSYMLQRMLGAGVCVAPQGAEHLYWMLPRGARVIEVLSELKITSAGAHMSGAASLEHWVVLMPRAKKEQSRPMLLERVEASLATYKEESFLPTVVLPTPRLGYHNHADDSFREMVLLWEAQGRCQVQRAPRTNYVWYGGIGKTLLYDRANFNWIEQDPEPYTLLLAGNPDASQKPNAKQWTFWPRHPKLVDEVAPTLAKTSFEDREKQLVFYGRIENQIQKDARLNTLYEACDGFDCPISTKKPYKYTAREYLNAISNSKFGLSMPGYGPKCNREIEYMAVGTVPVVAPDVDMDKYMDPPKEGVHYFRLKAATKEAVEELNLGAISEETWAAMSAACHAWWLANASAEGLWKRTQEAMNSP